jgi:hypothetical protein
VIDLVEVWQRPQWLHNVVVKICESWMFKQPCYVLPPPGDEVVDADDFVATSQQPFAEVGPDESSPSGYQSPH